MRVDLALLADYAEVSQRGGKLMVCGIFDRITMVDADSVHPHMALALKLSCDPGEESHHHLSVRLVDPDGGDVVPPMEGDVEIKPESDGDSSINLILDLNLVKFGVAGPHSFDVFLDGELQRQVPLTVDFAGRIDGP